MIFGQIYKRKTLVWPKPVQPLTPNLVYRQLQEQISPIFAPLEGRQRRKIRSTGFSRKFRLKAVLETNRR